MDQLQEISASVADKKRRRMDPSGKRLAIMACAEVLFCARGYQNTSMADIAGAADVAVGTLYRQFPDKLSLLAALHRAMEAKFIAVMETGWRSGETYPEKFEAMIGAIFNQAQSSLTIMPLYNLTTDLVSVDGYTPGKAMIEAIMAQYKEGVVVGALKDLDLTLVAASAHGMVEGAMKAWAANPTPDAHKAAITLVSQALTGAFCR
jgi:AcrR family transcriptional regulator